MSECDHRFNDGVYLLKCSKEDGHRGDHGGDDTTWTEAQGFRYVYDGVMIVGTVPEQVLKPEVETFEESAKRAPKFYDGVIKVSADKDGIFRKGALDAVAKSNKTIAERLAERAAINASLKNGGEK